MCTILFSLAIHMYTDHSLFTGLACAWGLEKARCVEQLVTSINGLCYNGLCRPHLLP